MAENNASHWGYLAGSEDSEDVEVSVYLARPEKEKILVVGEGLVGISDEELDGLEFEDKLRAIRSHRVARDQAESEGVQLLSSRDPSTWV